MKKRIIVVGLNEEGIRDLRGLYEIYWISAEPRPVEISEDDYHSIRDNPGYSCSRDDRLNEVITYVRKYAITIYETYARHWVIDRHPLPVPEFEVLLYSHIYWAFNLINKFKPDKIFFMNLPHEGFDNVLQLCARALGVITLSFYNVPFAPFHWVIEDGKDLSVLPSNLRDGMTGVTGFIGQIDGYVAEFLHKCAGMDKHWYMGGKFQSTKITFIGAKKAIEEHVERETKPPVEGASYLYFPLHLQPELTTAVLGGNYSNQLYAIKSAAEWAAVKGIHLLVKENPIQGISHRGEFFWKAFNTIPNITLVDGSRNSHELIANSCGVVTITGTAGIEGLVFKKPVICLGEIYYKKFRGVFSDFPVDLDWINYDAPSLSIIYSNLIEIMKCSYPGAIDPYCEKFFQIDPHLNTCNLVKSIKSWAD